LGQVNADVARMVIDDINARAAWWAGGSSCAWRTARRYGARAKSRSPARS